MLIVDSPARRVAGASSWDLVIFLCGILTVTPAMALDERPADWEANKACEKRLCTLILEKEPKGEDLSCALAKTWPKTTLKGGESKLVKWGFGDARCEVDLNVSRAVLLSALTLPTYSLEIPEHQVKCEVETDGEMKPVKAKLAPRIEFKNGKADKVWINLKDVSGPTSIKATVKAAAGLEDSLGIFHKSMIKSINKFVHKQCAERHGPNAEEFAARAEAEKAARRAARKAAINTTDTLPKGSDAPASAPVSDSAAAVVPGAAASTSELPSARAAAKPAETPTQQTPVATLPAKLPAAAKPDAVPKNTAAAKPAPAKAKSAAPVQLQLRTIAPWDVKPAANPKGP